MMTNHASTPNRPPNRPASGLSRRALQQRNQRVTTYRALVNPIALHYARRCPEPLDDLMQVGLLGLLRAAELYQPHTATPFEAFARPHIRGAILHYLRDSAGAVRLPRRQMELQDKLRQLRAQWGARHGQEPTANELRTALQLTPAQWHELERGQAMGRPIGLEGAGQEALTPLAEGMATLALVEADALMEQEERRQLLQRELQALEPGLRQVIQQVVLLGWTYRRTASLLKVSPMTVQRRLKRALGLLREALAQTAAAELSSRRHPHPVASAVPAC